MMINIELHIDEVNGVLNLLGKMPTETNVWPLCAKIREQAQTQLNAAQQQQQEPQDGNGEGSSAN